MRKKICSKCGKIIYEGTQCSCSKTTFVVNRKSNEKKVTDPIYTKRWKEKRMQIIKRDSYMCQRCFIKYNIINSNELTVHHILSRKHYPELVFEDENLVCLCATCNKQLGTKDKLDFEWDAKKHKEINSVVL